MAGFQQYFAVQFYCVLAQQQNNNNNNNDNKNNNNNNNNSNINKTNQDKKNKDTNFKAMTERASSKLCIKSFNFS